MGGRSSGPSVLDPKPEIARFVRFQAESAGSSSRVAITYG